MKNFTILAVLMLIASFSMAQNMGSQYVTLITVYDTVYTQPYEIALVSENPFPGKAVSLGTSISIGQDTLKADTQKDWADIVLISYGNDEVVMAQKPTLQKFYMASFVNRPYYFICRGEDCRWLEPLWTDQNEEQGVRNMRFEASMEWSAFQVTFYDLMNTVMLQEFDIMTDGSKFERTYVYRQPRYETYTGE